MSAILLDTCAVIWLMQGEPMTPASREAVRQAVAVDGCLVSAATAWEIGLLASRGRRPSMDLLPDPQTWLDSVFGRPGFCEIPLSAAIAYRATDLPGEFHADPADRFVVATALTLGLPVVTRDRAILGYAAGGYVRAIEC